MGGEADASGSRFPSCSQCALGGAGGHHGATGGGDAGIVLGQQRTAAESGERQCTDQRGTPA